jgi:putative ABC transport system permease protein
VANQLAVLVRNFRREKLYSAINIAGLALGLASCLLLGLFLKSELTYDQHYPDHKNIYRLVNEFTTGGRAEPLAITSDALGPVLAEEYPDVIRNYVRMRSNTNEGGIAMRRPEQPENVYYWEDSYFTDPHVFDVFPVKVLAGDPATALKEGDSVAISETVAKRYFGAEDPMGKLLQSDGATPRRVTLVFADVPRNTHVRYDLLFSNNVAFLRLADNATARRQQAIRGPQALTFTYLQMHPSFKPADWKRMSDEFTTKYMTQGMSAINMQWRSWLQPLADTHMLGEVNYDKPNGNAAYLFSCAVVALIILIIACINYMNLATARATHRARSVAFRKILGASRLSLGLQFMGEALLFSLVSLVLAASIVALALKFTPIGGLLDNKVGLEVLLDPQLSLMLVGIAVGIGLLSGLYPAVYLSSWAPLTALTGKQAQVGRGNLRMREFLVLVQFTISAAAIACTLLMIAQMRYVQTRPLGFEKENRLMVSLRGAGTIEKLASIRNELLSDSRVRAVAVTGQTPADGDRANMGLVGTEGEDGVMAPQLINVLPIGDDYEKVMGLTIKEGRDLSTRLLTDVGPNVLVNETLVKQMGWTNPIGKRIQANGDGRVVGVVKDFNFKSLHHQIEPLVMVQLNNDMSRIDDLNRPFQQRHLILDISPQEVAETLAHAERVMAAADPRHPFEARFLDEALDEQYGTEITLTKLIGIFAAISIFIACLGLFGLSAFTTEQRTREIGTRKVLGATAWQIVGLLARPVLVLVVVASALAGVAAYFLVLRLLEGFAYRADINPLIFLLSAAAAAAVAFATVTAQTWRTAHADPVESLRYR